MNQIPDERHLALRLAFLSPRDRRLLMSDLDNAAQSRMNTLLAELEEIGFKPDVSLLSDLEVSHGTTSHQSDQELDQVTLALERIQPADLVEVLSREPAPIRQAIVGMHAWHWSAAVKDAMVEASSSSRTIPGMSDRLKAALKSALLAKVIENQNRQARLQAESLPSKSDRSASRWFSWRR